MITLASDFGPPYPAAMRGVVRRRTDAELLDVSHDLPRGDVRAGAFWLRFLLPEFPPAVHCAVVDPGVGTDRAAVVVRAGDHAVVAPDNGLAIPAARRLAAGRRGGPVDAPTEDDPGIAVFAIDAPEPDSATFHGRDVFAPAAADVHDAGVDDLAAVDRIAPAEDYVDLSLPTATVDRNAAGEPVSAVGEVMVIDTFGNVITNVPGAVLDGVESVEVNGERVPVGETFADVDRGERLVTVGSHGYVECDVNDGRGDERFGLGSRSPIQLVF
ncbi:S-adenosyl-l-methionine hydroxide adenosyltransferase family protein [Haloparvum alkalitolerans]|uniref:SAM hydrolase/SAM-dependent halogenase family protein n=1 Tax=Haloparvum alkalitolerans TaxID=1042953 RepID=UPI003CEAB45F